MEEKKNKNKEYRSKIGEIEKGIPIPFEITSMYPYEGMEVGDSFLITTEDAKEVTNTRQKISASIAKFINHDSGKFKNWDFKSKMQRNENWDIVGFRIWRTK